MSLELSGGKVKVNFDLGSGVGSATSANRHNDGSWKSLTMSRNKKQGKHNNNNSLLQRKTMTNYTAVAINWIRILRRRLRENRILGLSVFSLLICLPTLLLFMSCELFTKPR